MRKSSSSQNVREDLRLFKIVANIPIVLLLKPVVHGTHAATVTTYTSDHVEATVWRSLDVLCNDPRFRRDVYVASVRWMPFEVYRVQLRSASEDVAREMCLREGAYAVYSDLTRKAKWSPRTPTFDLVLLECRTPRQAAGV